MTGSSENYKTSCVMMNDDTETAGMKTSLAPQPNITQFQELVEDSHLDLVWIAVVLIILIFCVYGIYILVVR